MGKVSQSIKNKLTIIKEPYVTQCSVDIEANDKWKEYANINEGQVKHWSLNETTVCYEKKWNFLGEKNSEMRNAVKDVKHMINRCTK